MSGSVGLQTAASPAPEAVASLPMSGLLALAMTGFIAILTEALPAGLLAQIGDGLQVSAFQAGQLVTAYALGSLIAAIPLVTLTQGWRRRPVLLVAILGFLLFNSITAISAHYALTLAARFMAGVAAGLAWGLIAGYARRMVPAAQQGRALAVAMVGTPIALSLGVPGGTWLGDLIGWRVAFACMSGFTLVLLAWVLCSVPDFPGQAATRRLRIGAVLRTPGVLPVLAVILGWMLAHNILYTYITPFLSLAGLQAQVAGVLLVFGVAAVLGILLIGVLVDRHLRSLVLLSLIGFGMAAVALAVGAQLPWVIYLAVALWGLTFGGAATLLQTACADAAGEGADIAQSMIVTVWNLAIAGGGLLGGVLLERGGPASLPWSLLLLIALALLCAACARAHGFKPGARRH